MMNSTLLSLAIVLLGVGVTLSAPLSGRRGGRRWRPETRDEQRNYLQTFGHWRGAKGKGSFTETDFRKSLKAFQRFAGIKDTGEANSETLNLMSTPRCGVSDHNEAPGRRRRYVASGTRWQTKALTYFFRNLTPDLPSSVTKSDVAKAFKYWSDVTPLTFNESQTTTSADIRVLFAAGDHGDGFPFDGPDGVLGHAFYPPSGDVHFDEDEDFTHASDSGINLLQVAVHEFGHILGLDHSEVQSAVMFPYYSSYDPNYKLDDDDINGIQAIYGKLAMPMVLSTKPTALPVEPTALPTKATSLPTKSTVLLTEPTSLPTEPTALPTKPTALPTKPTALPTKSNALPTEPTALPTKATALPIEPTTLPTKPTALPTKQTSLPTVNTPASSLALGSTTSAVSSTDVPTTTRSTTKAPTTKRPRRVCQTWYEYLFGWC